LLCANGNTPTGMEMMNHSPSRTATAGAALLLALVCSFAASAWASVHPSQGDDAGEPAPSVSTVHVVKEELTIDLRGVDAPHGLFHVSARYSLRNDGATQTVSLTFPLGHADLTLPPSSPKTARVSLDGKVVPQAETGGAREESARDAAKRTLGPAFVLEVSPGEHRLDVAYEATPSVVPLGDVCGFGVDYDLVGAQRWASVGSLAFTVRVPHGWRVVEHPAELRAFDPDATEYRAQFARFPRGDIAHAWRDGAAASLDRPDLLRLHIEPPLMLHRVLWVGQILALLMALALPVMALRRLRRRSQLASGVSLGQVVTSAFVCTALVVSLPLCGIAFHVTSYRYLGDVQLMLVLIALVWIVGCVSCWAGHVRLWRRVSAAR